MYNILKLWLYTLLCYSLFFLYVELHMLGLHVVKRSDY